MVANRLHQIERYAVDSSNIKSIGYANGICVVQFQNGHLYAYAMPEEDFETFARSESKGRYFNTVIRGKVAGDKLTGRCGKCGSEPEIIGETCSDCGTDQVRQIDKVHKE